MVFCSFASKRALLAVCSLGLLASCMHKKYETPITKNTQQPDKILFDQAMHDIEHGRYEVARISLNTLMNTYESSEYLAKAKLAIADSWYREAGPSGMAQAEAEYKDFILFYPSMEEAAEAQNRVCQIHYRQMEKSDRDWTQTLRAEDECRQLLVQFPNSKFAPQATQRLRNIQESLAEHEFVVGDFYFQRGANPAAANRLNALVDQYPLYSKADEALYEAGQSYSRMGPRFRQKAADMYDRIVSEYPLSLRVPDAKRDLADMEMPIPKVDEAALRRAKFEEENYHKPGMLFRYTEWMRGSPDVTHAAREGSPTMTDPKRTLPASIPVVNNNPETEVAGNGNGTGTTDVTASQVGSGGALDANADARTSKPSTEPQASPSAQTAQQQPLPTNRDEELKKMRAKQAKKQAQLAKKKNKKKHEAAPTEPVSTPAQGATGAGAAAPDTTTASSPEPANPTHTAPQS
jgi:outer membrane protein assembly factor BamD